MDEELIKIIKHTFTVDDSKIIERMIPIIEDDMSSTAKAKRIKSLDYILSGEIK